MFLNRQNSFLFLILAVSVGYLVSAMSLGAPVAESGLTPSFFPILVGAAAILFSTILIVQNRRETSGKTASDAPRVYTHLWVIAAIFVYIMAFRTVGYFISSGLFVFALIVIFSSVEKLVVKAVISAAIVAICYVMFQKLFGVRLPTLWG
ncbi:tripartite tricarboxylate transporter TctB family protein [Celeribacter halophilus]|uniref:Putative tricarboxylic transport membrane protein n=1 Tax=Celeribacter halophilus TaxID=576117 RepID=A0A1I3V9U7_9RHOB|nr:tripartite tricarboxylate transporter TctB family protein [Celeribacter halophilus]MDO6455950.1 tripartite tricarboxylate transporter TctB family protein [Celeribacter halophilus]PZX09600.1 putative tricarboxylic transport membrane protein [Celeribacter halophilus]SFJ92158.1 putative tricarboxylic transport membrane protein [Celeribacter halophilus]